MEGPSLVPPQLEPQRLIPQRFVVRQFELQRFVVEKLGPQGLLYHNSAHNGFMQNDW
jgi:hypothetical protein